MKCAVKAIRRRKKLSCVEDKEKEREKKEENIWKSNSNNKSLQVKEVEYILRLAKLCAPRD